MSSNDDQNQNQNQNQNLSGVSIYLSNRWNLFKTIYLVFTWIVLGMHLELVGPTLDILAQQSNVLYDGISYVLVFRSVGYLLPNLLGFLIRKVVEKHSELLMSLCYFIAFLVMFLTPFINKLFILCVLFFFQGISQGVNDLAGTNLVLSMWKKNSGAPLNMVHLGYGFGAVLANLLALGLTDNTDKSETKQSLVIPYSICGIICLIISLGHLFIWIRQKKINKENLSKKVDQDLSLTSQQDQIEREKEEEKEKSSSQMIYVVSMTTIWIIYMFFLSGNDQTFGKFFFVYLKSKFTSSRSVATWAMIVFWLSYSFGRLLFAILAVFLSPTNGLNLVWILGIVIISLWLLFLKALEMTIVHLFVLGALTGLTFSPTFPLSFAFISQHLKSNPLFLGLFLCGGSIGAMVFQKISGPVIDKKPDYFPYLMIVCVSGSILFYVLALVNSWFHQKTLKSKKSQIDKSLPKEDVAQTKIQLVEQNENN